MTAARTAAYRLARLGAVLAILLGIFGMHALSHHGTTHVELTSSNATVLASSMATDAAAVHADHQSSPTTGLTVDTGKPGHSLGDMVLLCMTMTMLAVATLLGLLAIIRRVTHVWVVLRRTATLLRPTSWLNPTGTGPPSVWQFSVIRC